jgi:hypothetical protein
MKITCLAIASIWELVCANVEMLPRSLLCETSTEKLGNQETYLEPSRNRKKLPFLLVGVCGSGCMSWLFSLWFACILRASRQVGHDVSCSNQDCKHELWNKCAQGNLRALSIFSQHIAQLSEFSANSSGDAIG